MMNTEFQDWFNFFIMTSNEVFSYLYLLVCLLYVDLSTLSSTPNSHRIALCWSNHHDTTNINPFTCGFINIQNSFKINTIEPFCLFKQKETCKIVQSPQEEMVMEEIWDGMKNYISMHFSLPQEIPRGCKVIQGMRYFCKRTQTYRAPKGTKYEPGRKKSMLLRSPQESSRSLAKSSKGLMQFLRGKQTFAGERKSIDIYLTYILPSHVFSIIMSL